MKHRVFVPLVLVLCLLMTGGCAIFETEDKPQETTVLPPEVQEQPEPLPDYEGLKSDQLRGEITDLKRINAVNELAAKHLKLTVTDGGFDVFVPGIANSMNYRYGPAVLLNEDGSVDAWFSAPGDGYREYDYITYKHSEDGGETWSDEKVVLAPTPNSPDALSVCDPAVFFYDGYYYLGYSSTISKREKGLCNSTFIARSKKPDGPYEKWNGQGWGGNPVPLIYFDGVVLGWGSGEPSFVIVDDLLYIYSTKDSYSAVPKRIRLTEVRTANLKQADWPAHLCYEGIAVNRSDTDEENEGDDGYVYEDADSWDVAYVDEAAKFIAVDANRRFSSNSCLLYYESNDGVHFERVSELNTNVIKRCHNCGIMKDGAGHIQKGAPVMLSYAYGGSNRSAWGVWGTRFAPALIELTDEIDRSEEDCENLSVPLICRAGVGSASPIMLKTDKLLYRTTVGSEAFSISQYLRDGYHGGYVIAKEDVTLSNYDAKILSIDRENRITPLMAGETSVTVSYRGSSREVAVCVLPQNGANKNEVLSFVPMTKRYEVDLHPLYLLKVRPMAVFADYGIHELTGPEMIAIGLTFTTQDPSICDIWGDGTLIPQKQGRTLIEIKTDTGLHVTIPVNVR